MAKTLEQVRRQLSAVEPNDSTYHEIGPSEVPLLDQLLQASEPWLAARAVVAASRIADSQALKLLERAARDPREEVRVALAASLARLPARDADSLLLLLLADANLGVRKFAIKSVSPAHAPSVLDKLRDLQAGDPVAAIREGATSRLRQLNLAPKP